MPQGHHKSEESPGSSGVGHSLALASLGITMAASVGIGAGIGVWLDGRWGTQPWLTVTGLVLGSVAGFLELWRVVQRAGGDD